MLSVNLKHALIVVYHKTCKRKSRVIKCSGTVYVLVGLEVVGIGVSFFIAPHAANTMPTSPTIPTKT